MNISSLFNTAKTGLSSLGNGAVSSLTASAGASSLDGSTDQASSDAASAGQRALSSLGKTLNDQINTELGENKLSMAANNAETAMHNALKANQAENKASENGADGVKELV